MSGTPVEMEVTAEVTLVVTGRWYKGDGGVPATRCHPGEPASPGRLEVADVVLADDLVDWLTQHMAEVQDLAEEAMR